MQGKKISIFLILIFFFSFFQTTILAADQGEFSNSFGVIYNLAVNDKDAKDGAIVVLSGQDIVLSSSSYENVIVGVINTKPAFSLKSNTPLANISASGGTSFPIINSCNAVVNVSAINGEIKKGDLVTTSSMKGVAMKATESGYVLGSALEDFSSENKEEVKQIPISLNIHYSDIGNSITTRIRDIFRLAVLAAYEQPRLALKYIASTILLIVTVVFSFISVGKLARLGIIAVARNPLASKKIYKSILMNVLSSAAIIGFGIIATYFMLKL